MTKIALSEKDFQALVRGEVVERELWVPWAASSAGPNLQIILQDIGWVSMLKAIHEARMGEERKTE